MTLRYLLLLGCLYGSVLSAQTKFEHEQRLPAADVPETARSFVAGLGPDSKVRWYKETNERDTTIEAKTKRRGRWHSIEFHRWGALEDVEIKIPYDSIPVATRDSICNQLYRQTERFRVAKTQVQYSGPLDAVQRAVLRNDTETVTVRYELVVKAETDAGFELLEFLFDAAGTQLDRATVVFRNTDHLDY